jgi:putative ABC transport system substrate-binding protein
MQKTLLCLVVAAALGAGPVANAQQPKKIHRIGYLGAASSSANTDRVEAFRRGLREVGYIEGKNIFVEYRHADEKFDRLPALVAELVGLKVDIIVSGGSTVTRPAKEATATIPIVMTNDSDPVGDGFIASLARPGRNITGLSNFAPELTGKRLELLREIVPKISRVAVLWTSTGSGTRAALQELEGASGALKVKLQYLDVQNPKDIENAFRAGAKGRAEGVLVMGGAILVSQRVQIVEFAAKNRLPAIYHRTEFVEEGGLMFYGVNLPDLSRRAAVYVDKILKGAKPADLPVEQPIKFEFIINLKAAKQIGLTIPPNVLVRADRVIR